ncbi:hypothetical protein LC612_30715 [Nostoc sp. CHAB 5834]|nr:hypothetical protein [Nostoc sp. CHAB 5834]
MTINVNNCVLVTLTISVWDFNRQDNRVSADVAKANEVQDRRMCRLRKTLLPKNQVMDEMVAIIRAIRKFHYANTLAWMHDGPRMLPTANFTPYMDGIRDLKAQLEAKVLEFFDAYPTLAKTAEQSLGKLYDATDYPSVESLRKKYSMDVKVQPLPSAEGLLQLGLESEDAQAFRMKLQADMEDTFLKANQRMWNELYSRLAVLHERLSDEDATVRKGTIAAVQELTELLPRMNLTGDERLEALTLRLQSSLKGLSEESLKHDPSTRERVTTDTRKVFSVMQAFMNPSQDIEEEGMLRAA